MKRLRLLAQWIDTLNKRVGESISYLFLPLLVITGLEVTLRYVFNRPTIWAWDVNIHLFAVIVTVGGGYVLLSGRFVVVDILVTHLSAKGRARLNLITSILIFFVIAILVWLGGKEAWYSWITRERFTSLWEPILYPVRFLVFIGFILLFFQVVSRFIHNLLIATGREENPSGASVEKGE